MLSILIPVYNYNILPLVEEIHRQATACDIVFEIIIIDDCSSQDLFDIDKIEAFSNTKISINQHNIGRSAIRNLLAAQARYENLLFVDAGTFPKSITFISDYMVHIEADVTIGGMAAERLAPRKPYKLRWLYTKKREAFSDTNNADTNVFTSANFLIKKSIIQSYPFNERIKRYGFEDYLFFNTLKNNSFRLNFINNPVIHDSKEDAHTFIQKTEDGLRNLVLLSESNSKQIDPIKIWRAHSKLKSLGLIGVATLFFKLFKPLFIKNFNSSHTYILLFDFYKLGFLSALISKKA